MIQLLTRGTPVTPVEKIFGFVPMPAITEPLGGFVCGWVWKKEGTLATNYSMTGLCCHLNTFFSGYQVDPLKKESRWVFPNLP